MFFETIINFNRKFSSGPIVGFQVSPIKEVKKGGLIMETVKCDEAQAQGYSVMAITGELPEWIADVKSKEDADDLAKLLGVIYSIGFNSGAGNLLVAEASQSIEPVCDGTVQL